MTGMFGRLAYQAMAGKNTGSPSRIRPASAVHASVPLSGTREPDVPPVPPPGPAVEEAPVDAVLASPIDPSRPMTSPARDAREVPLPPATFPAGMKLHVMERDRVVVRHMQTIERTRDVPAPLLTEAPAPRLVPIGVMPSPGSLREDSNDQSARRDEPTEVHVHIGRIEVTAAPDRAPTRKTKPAPSRETLPLADYLSRKSRP